MYRKPATQWTDSPKTSDCSYLELTVASRRSDLRNESPHLLLSKKNVATPPHALITPSRL